MMLSTRKALLLTSATSDDWPEDLFTSNTAIESQGASADAAAAHDEGEMAWDIEYSC